MRVKLAFFLVFSLTLAWAKGTSVAPGIDAATFKTLDAMVTRALAAYNKGDARAFYADYAKSMAGVATPQAFKALYVDMYKKQLGNYKSRKLMPEKCTGAAMNAVLFYNGKFDKGQAKIVVNFFKEGGAWKLQQVQFTK